MSKGEYVGRFAPSPSGRMHLGNVYAALLSWLFAKRENGKFLLRIEDIDKARCKDEYIEILLDDLKWLGISYEQDNVLFQKERTHIYEKALCALRDKGLLYPCFCTRADLHAASAPHEADGRSIYSGHCSFLSKKEAAEKALLLKHSVRCRAPNIEYCFTDGIYGHKTQNPALDWGDFIVKRSDGAFAYQLAVSVDDGEGGVNHIVRGRDLLQSVSPQEYLKAQLGYESSSYTHFPLLISPDGKRLSKREKSLDMGILRQSFTAPRLLGKIARLCGIISEKGDISINELACEFSPKKIGTADIVVNDSFSR